MEINKNLQDYQLSLLFRPQKKITPRIAIYIARKFSHRSDSFHWKGVKFLTRFKAVEIIVWNVTQPTVETANFVRWWNFADLARTILLKSYQVPKETNIACGIIWSLNNEMACDESRIDAADSPRNRKHLLWNRNWIAISIPGCVVIIRSRNSWKFITRGAQWRLRKGDQLKRMSWFVFS